MNAQLRSLVASVSASACAGVAALAFACSAGAQPGTAGATDAREDAPPAVSAPNPGAQELFQAWCRATEGANAGTPVRSFELAVEVLTRKDGQTNNDRAQLGWLAPDWVRFRLASGRELGRGPAGPWLRERAEVVPLVGRDYEQDRLQLTELANLAANFAALCTPSTWQVARLERLAAAPTGLPPAARAEAARLVWLRLETDALRRPRAPLGAPAPAQGGSEAPVRTLELLVGIDPHSGAARQCVLGSIQGRVLPGQTQDSIPREEIEPLFLGLVGTHALGGRSLPKGVLVHERDATRPLEFEARARLELWLLPASKLGGEATPADFDARVPTAR
jgi:hypothetical protein